MTNYICINGKKAELTEEQMKALGIELPKASPFKRAKNHEKYYTIDQVGVVRNCTECYDGVDNVFYKIGNYCTDKAIMEQRALHETLNRLLWRYSMEHDGDKIDWINWENTNTYTIMYNHQKHKFSVISNVFLQNVSAVSFYTLEIAENAIEEIIKPFMKEHPEFVW